MINTTLQNYLQQYERKWELFKYSDLYIDDLSKRDIDLINNLQEVGSGEIRGLGMAEQFSTMLKTIPKEERIALNESYIFLYQIVYEELKHGLSLKSLKNKNYVDELTYDNIDDFIWNNKTPWNNPFEMIVSFLFGEVVNVELYRSARNVAENIYLKELLSNIMKDEAKHLNTWKMIHKNLYDNFPNLKMIYDTAIIDAINIHQAALGYDFDKGLNNIQSTFEYGTGVKIVKEKIKTLEYIYGDDPLPLTKIEIIRSLKQTGEK